MDIHELPYRLKSARTKKRLVKTDRDKQLIKLNKRRTELWQQKRALPLVPLQNPYQNGWKRFFVLRADVANGKRAEFYTALLAKINTFEHHQDKTFKKKKRRKKRYGYEIKLQVLREFSTTDWNSSKLNLTEEEKNCFTQVITYDVKTRKEGIKYVFTEPWRYILKIAPHMITHKKLLDSDIERETDEIDRYIEINDFEPRISRLTRGRGYHYRWQGELTKYAGRTKRIPKYAGEEDYLDLV